MGKFTSHVEYFQSKPQDIQLLLTSIQTMVRSEYPDAHDCIGYNMPAFRTSKTGKIFIYFAAFENHIGIYPPIKHDDVLIKDLAPYRGAKGNLSFPLSEPLPLSLIEHVIRSLRHEYK